MKKVFYLIIVITALSCSDFLDREPVEQVSQNEQLKSLSGILEATNGNYVLLERLYSGDNFYPYADALGGNQKFAPNQSGSITVPVPLQNSYSFNASREVFDFDSFYNNAYKIINNINLVLENVALLTDASTLQKDQIRAEMLAMRAMVHFELLRIFAQPYNFSASAQHPGIVYNQKVLKAGIDFPKRRTVAESYNLVEADYLKAIQLFTPDQAFNYGAITSYFTVHATKSLLARLYIYQENWSEAKIMAEQVIDKSGILLTPTNAYINQWQTPDPISEILLELKPPLDNFDGLTSSSVSQFYGFILDADGKVIDAGKHTASQDLIKLFAPDDLRTVGSLLRTFMMETNGENGTEFLPYHYTTKYINGDGTLIIRLSEMYLISAEANYKLGNETQALIRLNDIYTRANPNKPFSQNLSGNLLIQEIYDEQRREFAFENHLFFDVVRTKRNVVRNDGCVASTCNLNYPNFRFIQPIPEDAVIINENMVQNEGY